MVALNKLSVSGIKSKKPGRYGDGGGLWLQVRDPSHRSWLFRYAIDGKQRQMGLGPLPDVSLAEARDAAMAARKLLRAGEDPIEVKRAGKAAKAVDAAAMSFRAVLDLYLAAHEETWKNPKHRQQWRNSLDTYAMPIFGDRLVAAVDTGAVMRVIEPIWKAKPETASRVRGRIEAVLDYATARGWRLGDNPARWRGHVENLLPARSKMAKVEHHAALPWEEIGGFMARLQEQPGTGALALQFTIYTAARTGEVIGARWSEIDLPGRTWTIPGERMKAGVTHRVPLSDAAMKVLHEVLPAKPAKGDGFVFPGRDPGKALSNMSLSAVLRRMDLDDLTVHGFRSTFRQWAGESTNVAREVAEAALAHTLKDKVEAAYQRGDMFEKRRWLMGQWSEFCGTTAVKKGEIIAIGAAK